MGYQTTPADRLKRASKKAANNLADAFRQKSAGNGTLVRATDYAAPAGIPALGYSAKSKTVTVDGQAVPTAYMDGDRAVVSKDALDRAYQNVLDRNGIKTAKQLEDNWNDKYAARLNDSVNHLQNRKDWKYIPEQDPAYQAYKAQYEREGMQAYQNALAEMAARNRGNMTSAAVTVANQQLGQYLAKLSDQIPKLAQNSYERYQGDYERDSQSYSKLSEFAAADWKRMQEQNEQAKADYQTWVDAERKRTEQRQADEKFLQNLEIQQQKAGYSAENQDQKLWNYAWQNAERRGYFTAEEIALLNIPQNADGSYPSPDDIKNAQSRQYFQEVEIPQLDYKSWLDRMQKQAELEQRARNDAASKGLQYDYNRALAAYRASLK